MEITAEPKHAQNIKIYKHIKIFWSLFTIQNYCYVSLTKLGLDQFSYPAISRMLRKKLDICYTTFQLSTKYV